jgi:hypothetical protein
MPILVAQVSAVYSTCLLDIRLPFCPDAPAPTAIRSLDHTTAFASTLRGLGVDCNCQVAGTPIGRAPSASTQRSAFGIATTKLEMLRSAPPLSIGHWSKWSQFRRLGYATAEACCETDCSARRFDTSSRNLGGKRRTAIMALVLELYGGVLAFSTIAFLAIAWASGRGQSRKQIDLGE